MADTLPHLNRAAQDLFDASARIGRPGASSSVTQYIGDTHNVRTLIPMNTRTQTLPLGASSKTVPANPQD
jgi:hypothetical protein